MFAKKRGKREFPHGTFIPTPQRVVAILQLCLAFTVIIASCCYPFLGELFAHKSNTLLYENVMGNSVLADKLGKHAPAYRELLKRNSERFIALPESQRNPIIQQYDQLQAKSDKTFLSKIRDSFMILAKGLPAFERAWIFFAIVIPLLLLLRIEGAAKAAWLLPIIVVLYAADNYLYGASSKESADANLFPTEQVIVAEYLKEPLSSSILEQQQELTRGWELYLVSQWAREQPSTEASVFEQQVERGQFAFNLARIKAIAKESAASKMNPIPLKQKEPLIVLLLYVLWNFFFAWWVNRNPLQINYSI